MKKKFFLFLAMFIVASFGNSAEAEDFSTAVSKALEEIPVGADVPFNASTMAGFSTRNPAGIAAVEKDASKFGVNGTYGHIGFKNGLNVDLYSPSVTVNSSVGVFQLTFTDAKSNNAALLDGTSNFQFNKVQSIDLQYGFPIAGNFLVADDSLYLGLSGSHSMSDVTTTLAEVGSLNTQSKGNAVGIGAMYRIGKIANFGAFYERSWDGADDFVDGSFDANSKSQSSKLRLGTSVQITSTTLLAVDYQHLYLAGGENADQYFFGAEQYLIKDALALYGGYADGGIAAGLGFYSSHAGINLAYQRHLFQSLEQYFGKANMFMVSAYWTF